MKFGLLLAATALAADLRIEPPAISLPGPGSVQRILVSLDGRDVTTSARFESASPDIADAANAAVRGNRAGTARIRVQASGANAEFTVRVGNESAAPVITLTRDVLSILTTKGCNSSSCHGSPAGQNGFKLSLYGSDPAADHAMILTAHNGRRVDRANPAASLLLRKPTYAVAHGGGKLMGPDSDEYRVLLGWLQQGAQLDSGGARLDRIELLPADRVLKGAGTRQPVVAIGRYSDGTTRDMTTEVRYSVVDTGVISEPANAVITAKGRGLTTIMARAFGKTATAQYIVTDERVIDSASDSAVKARAEAFNFIDELVQRRLREVNVEPFPLADDRTFVRRVHLDAIGVPPTRDEVAAFLVDARADKRSRLIAALLERPEYASHWMVKFEDWFRNHQFNSQGRTNASFKKWIRDMVERDDPYDQTVRALLTSQGDTTVKPAGNFWHPAMDFMLKTFDVNKITPTVSRLFLGMRIECAECHNHPLENLTQDDFYGMAAFFGRLGVKHGYGQYRRIWFDQREGEVKHPVTKQPVPPKFLFGEQPAIVDPAGRRVALSDWIVRNPQFARATVNRIWHEYFRTGIVEPFDDFRSTNRATNPELLDRLADHFAANGFRFKPLHRLILESRTYQTASRSPGLTGESGAIERLLFARYEPRQLSAEVLLDTISQVTGVPHSFGLYPRGTSSKDLVATNGPDYFLTAFGFPRRDILAERAESPSLAQSLHMMNSDTIRAKVEAKDNLLSAAIDRGLDDDAIIATIWETALARPPRDSEWRSIRGFLANERDAGRPRRRMLENVLWVALNAKEFRINQ